MNDFDEFRLVESYIKNECISDVYGTSLPFPIMGIISEYCPLPLTCAIDRIISENYGNSHQCMGCHTLVKQHAELPDTLIDQLHTIHLVSNHKSNPRFSTFLSIVKRIEHNTPLAVYYYQILSKFISLYDYTHGKTHETERHIFRYINSHLGGLADEATAYRLAALLLYKNLFQIENVARVLWGSKPSPKEKQRVHKHARLYLIDEIMEIIVPTRFAHLHKSEKNKAIASMFKWDDSTINPIVAVPNIYGNGIYVCKLLNMKILREEFREFANPTYISWVLDEFEHFKSGLAESKDIPADSPGKYYFDKS